MQKAIITIAIAVLSVLCLWLAYENYSKRNFIPPEHHNQVLDERTRVLSARIVSAESIRDSIAAESQAQADWIEANKEKVIAYTQLSGMLRMYRDSLKTARRTEFRLDDLPTGEEPDTTITHFETFTDELFGVTCSVRFSSSGCVSISADLSQLRPINISFTVTDRGHDYINTYLHLPDFDLEQTEQISFQPKPVPERTAWQRVQTALIWGGVAVAILKLIEIVL